MKKSLIFSLVFILVMVNFVLAQTTCSDAEGSADNYFAKNKITAVVDQGGSASVEDGCLSDLPSIVTDTLVEGGIITSSQLGNENILIESYCPSSLPTSLSDLRPFQKSYVCPNGCEEGRCKFNFIINNEEVVVEGVNEIEENGETYYLISGTKKAKLFFIFSISAKVEQKVDVNGEIIFTKKPWWSFLARGI